MSVLYSVAGHPLVSPKAAALAPAVFDAHNALAEALLLLLPPPLTDPAAVARASLAVALQVNYQVAMGIDPFVVASVSSGHSGQSTQYHRGTVAAPLPVHEQSRLLVADLIARTYANRFASVPTLRATPGQR